MRKIGFAVMVITLMFIAAGCFGYGSGSGSGSVEPEATIGGPSSVPSAPVPTASPKPSAVSIPSPAPTPVPEPETYRAKLAAIGDVLIHNTVYQDASDGKGAYNFMPMFEPVKELLRQSDITVANQESLTGGTALGLSSYPMFNSPYEVGDALKDAGVDLVTMANNHTMDKGEKGVLSATSNWDRIGMPYTGAFRNPEDREQLRTLEAGGITFGFLAYTYGTNGMPIPPDKPYLVNLLDAVRMEDEIKKAKQAADVVVVSVHWGVENEPSPNSVQREWAKKLADWGADIIIGTHPHVLQTFEWLSHPEGRRTLVMYSLGNFLSAQDKLPQLIGGIGQVEVVKTVTGEQSAVRLEKPSFIPTYNKYKNWRKYRVIPLNRLEQADSAVVQPVWERIRQRLSEAMPELTIAD